MTSCDPSFLQRLDKRHLWHPFTQMHDYADRDLLLIDRAAGLFLYDAAGRAYYDTISSWWCIVHGHNHPHIMAALRRQTERLDQVLLAGITHENAILLAKRLVDITPASLTRVFFSDNGSTACEVAMKMALQYWQQAGEPQRKRFVGVERGYHGDTIGTMSVGGTPGFHQAFAPLCFASFRIPAPYCYRCPVGAAPEECACECSAPLAELLERRGHEIAACIVEPLILAAGGMIVYPAAYLRVITELCRRHGVLVIFDEVATGFGRTGKMFAFEHAGTVPDFLCLSKGITGGTLPLAATMTTEEIFAAFYGPYAENRTFYHGHTFTGNPLAAAAALANLELFEQEDTLNRLQPVIRHLHQAVRRFHALEQVGDVRCLGTIVALELVRDRRTKEPFTFEERVGWPIYLAGLEHGLILRPLGNVIYLWLPLTVTAADVDAIVERVWTVLTRPGVLPPS